MTEEKEIDLTKVKAFEVELDDSLSELVSLTFNGEECIALALSSIEMAHGKENYGLAAKLEDGLNVLSPYFIKNKSDITPKIEQLLKDVLFAGDYYILREYLYYTYNSPNSFQWDFNGNDISIKFNDRTIPRQFFIEANNFYIRSKEIFSNYTESEKISNLLKNVEEFSLSSKVEKAINLIIEEVNLKLDGYYNFIDINTDINFGQYSYKEFYEIFRLLLVKSLYHRYYAKTNNIFTTITLPFDSLISDLSTESGIPEHICAEVIKEISYGVHSEKDRIQPMYYSLYYLVEKKEVIMSPFNFSVWEGFVNFFRIIALKQPQLFQDNISPHLNEGFEANIKKMFSDQGFSCFRELNLNKFDERLPDIDLLAVSEEPTFGYFAYFCEIKNPIPAIWAKDQLRVLNKDSVVKAFKQVDLINEFLETEEGIIYFRSLLPKDGLPHFGDQFIMAVNNLIITSANSGMFFGNQKHAIINYHLLDHILLKSDGDVTYISWALNNLSTMADECFKVVTGKINVGTKNVSYEAVAIDKILELSQNEYKSKGIDKQLAEGFIKDGFHPFDTFKDYPSNIE